ncbi:MAG: DUF4434 domain-containing protein [Arachnia propionica]
MPEEKRRVVFSPYASFEDPSRAAYFEDRFRDIVHTGAGRVDVILAPQDGVGTGKVSPSDKDSVASPENVTTLYAAAQNASASETWANIELFVRDSSTCRAGSITFTSDCSAHKARIDQQIELAEPYAQKILAYDWSMYMSRARVSADSQETLVSYLLRTGAQNDALGEDQPRSSADVELEAAGDRPAGCQTDLGAELIWGWTARRDARSSLSPTSSPRTLGRRFLCARPGCPQSPARCPVRGCGRGAPG